jgi:hypothetical protein
MSLAHRVRVGNSSTHVFNISDTLRVPFLYDVIDAGVGKSLRSLSQPPSIALILSSVVDGALLPLVAPLAFLSSYGSRVFFASKKSGSDAQNAETITDEPECCLVRGWLQL